MARFTQNAGGTGTELNYVQVAGEQVTISSAPNAFIDLNITTTGKPVQISVTGEGSNASAGSWVRINLFRDNVAIGNEMQIEASAVSENVPFAINFIDNVAAGTYNYSARVTEKSSGNWQFGEVDGPIMNAVELTGFKGDDGADGADGTDGEDGADALWNFLGEWQNGVDYAAGSVVEFEGSSYYTATGAYSSYSPGMEGIDWVLVAAKGADGTGGGGDIADFIFTDNGGESTITLPGAKVIKIISGEEEDLYIIAGDDLHLQSVDDDIHIQSSDDVRFVANYGTGTESYWRMDNNGYLYGPGSNEALKVVGLAGEDSVPLFITGGDAVVLNGSNGEYLNDSNNSDNQIATVGDISEVFSGEVSFTVNGGSLGTQPTFDGDPLFSGTYVKTGPLVHFQIQVDMDNITSFGNGQYYVDLPFTAKYGYQVREGCLHDISTDRQYAIGGHVYAGQSRLNLFFTDTNGQDQEFDYNSPITLAVDDNFHISGTYIAN